MPPGLDALRAASSCTPSTTRAPSRSATGATLVYGNGDQRAGDRLGPRARRARRVGLPQAALRDPEGRRRRLVGLAVVHARSARCERRALPREALGRRLRERVAARGRRSRRLRRPAPDDGHPRRRALAVPGLPRAGRATAGIVCRPAIAAIDGRAVTFTDGTREAVDAIVCATGYDARPPVPADGVLARSSGPTSPRTSARCTPTCRASASIGQFLAQGPYFPLLELQARWIVGRLGGRGRAARRRAPCARAIAAAAAAARRRTTCSRWRSPRSSASRPTCAPGPSSPSRCCSARCCRRATASTARARSRDAAERFAEQLAASPRAPVDPADVEALRGLGLARRRRPRWRLA